MPLSQMQVENHRKHAIRMRAMRHIRIEPTFESWRDAARGMLAAGIVPEEVLWSDAPEEAALFASPLETPVAGTAVHKVPASFMDIARTAAAHTDPRRWGMLYRLLWRITRGGESALLAVATDPDIRMVQNWCKAVGREIHKMHAFVRFRLVGKNEVDGREQFVAWFEPQYRIVRLASPFFRNRFASMDWSILTPYECAHWDGESLHFTPGVPRDAAPDDDALDELWRGYYRSIFNPARLKVKAMQSEMAKRYWKNLPEARIIDELVAGCTKRVRDMLDAEERPVKPAPKIAYLEKLRGLNESDGTPT
jgi:probable DNA metabolism protein